MDDYIKREDALEIVNSNLSRFMIALRIGDCPSADVAPVRHGHWIKISPAGIYECSECGKNVITSGIEAYEHCHGCGARMDTRTTNRRGK